MSVCTLESDPKQMKLADLNDYRSNRSSVDKRSSYATIGMDSFGSVLL